ncbi:MAG: repeat protein [Pedosphaera sp.]|nr:repeat protein [Pedosphaera sp.]
MKPYRIIFVMVLVAICGGLAWQVLRPREPVYREKALSAWCEQYATNHWAHPDSELHKQAETAIRHMGTNAIPALMNMLRASDSPLQRKFFDLAYKQNLVKIHHVNPWKKNWLAASAFAALGADGRSAAPGLIDLFENPPSSSSGRYTAMALAGIGPAASNAIPSLLRKAESSPETGLRLFSLNAIGHIHARPELVIPLLIKYLNDPSLDVQNEAAEALGAYGADARTATPIMLQLLQNPNQDLRGHVPTNLLKIDPEAATKAGVK